MMTLRPCVRARRQAAETAPTPWAVRPLPAGVPLGTVGETSPKAGMSRWEGAKSVAPEPAEAAEKRAHPIEIGTSTL